MPKTKKARQKISSIPAPILTETETDPVHQFLAFKFKSPLLSFFPVKVPKKANGYLLKKLHMKMRKGKASGGTETSVSLSQVLVECNKVMSGTEFEGIDSCLEEFKKFYNNGLRYKEENEGNITNLNIPLLAEYFLLQISYRFVYYSIVKSLHNVISAEDQEKLEKTFCTYCPLELFYQFKTKITIGDLDSLDAINLSISHIITFLNGIEKTIKEPDRDMNEPMMIASNTNQKLSYAQAVKQACSYLPGLVHIKSEILLVYSAQGINIQQALEEHIQLLALFEVFLEKRVVECKESSKGYETITRDKTSFCIEDHGDKDDIENPINSLASCIEDPITSLDRLTKCISQATLLREKLSEKASEMSGHQETTSDSGNRKRKQKRKKKAIKNTPSGHKAIAEAVSVSQVQTSCSEISVPPLDENEKNLAPQKSNRKKNKGKKKIKKEEPKASTSSQVYPNEELLDSTPQSPTVVLSSPIQRVEVIEITPEPIAQGQREEVEGIPNSSFDIVGLTTTIAEVRKEIKGNSSRFFDKALNRRYGGWVYPGPPVLTKEQEAWLAEKWCQDAIINVHNVKLKQMLTLFNNDPSILDLKSQESSITQSSSIINITIMMRRE